MSFNLDVLNRKEIEKTEDEKRKTIDKYMEKKEEIKLEKVSNFEVGVEIADFVAELYRPKPRKGGIVAQFFCPNGPYADAIVGLHLTRFQDVYVKVSVWVIKDKNGAVLIRESTQPSITEFIAKIERPSPSRDGQTALFFGRDGEDADAINILSRSEFIDSFVFVRVQIAEENSIVEGIKTETPEDLLNKTHLMTREEEKEFEKKQKFYKDCNQTLKAQGFFRNEKVMSKLLTPNEMLDYISKKPCCCKAIGKKCETGDKKIIPYEHGGFNSFSYIPLCKTHFDLYQKDENMGNIGQDFSSWADFYCNTITIEKLKSVLRLNPKEEIPPARLREWATKNDLYSILPNKYLQQSEISGFDR